MSESHFVVYQRDASLPFTHKSSMTAPFTTLGETVAASIAAAGDSGVPYAVVIVEAPGLPEPTVWRQAGDNA